MNDEQLMIKYQNGDVRAFEELYARHKGKVYGYLMANLKEESKAEEVFQNVFVKLHRKRGQYDPKHSFVKWLFIIAKTQMLDFLKREWPSVEYVEEVHYKLAEGMEETVNFEEVNSLNENEKAALSLRYREDSEFSDIALALSVSSANARKIVSRGLQKLKKALLGDQQ